MLYTSPLLESFCTKTNVVVRTREFRPVSVGSFVHPVGPSRDSSTLRSSCVWIGFLPQIFRRGWTFFLSFFLSSCYLSRETRDESGSYSRPFFTEWLHLPSRYSSALRLLCSYELRSRQRGQRFFLLGGPTSPCLRGRFPHHILTNRSTKFNVVSSSYGLTFPGSETQSGWVCLDKEKVESPGDQ